jgi:hypothetical protein
MLKKAMNYAVFGAFLIIVGFLGFFLWQTLFATKENVRGSEQTEITKESWLRLFEQIFWFDKWNACRV